jgi:hypothetical protein
MGTGDHEEQLSKHSDERTMRRIPAVLACCAMSFLYLPPAEAQTFRAGFAKQDITPTKPTPMWGYGARQAALSTGVRDPLYAKALVIDVGSEKLALVGLDLGRAPREDMLVRIREAIRQSCGVGMSLIVGSHTHHGPVIELLDEPGKGRGAFDDAVAYATELEQKIIAAIEQAAADVRPAKIGWGAKPVDLNRNRHSKIEPKPVDRELGVIRLDGLDGNPIAVIVNFAAHPTMLEVSDLRFSAEWPGQMMNAVEAELGAPCLFLQGALGDLSVQKTDDIRDIETFGQALAEARDRGGQCPGDADCRPAAVADARGGVRVQHPDADRQPAGPVVVQPFVFSGTGSRNDGPGSAEQHHPAAFDRRSDQPRIGPGRRLGRMVLPA